MQPIFLLNSTSANVDDLFSDKDPAKAWIQLTNESNKVDETVEVIAWVMQGPSQGKG